jgi:hypothetical protein
MERDYQMVSSGTDQSKHLIKDGFERGRVLRALTIILTSLMKDAPEIFSGTVEVDETALGGQWKNQRSLVRDLGSKRGRGTTKQPVFGILCRNSTVWAEVVDDVGAETLQPLILKKSFGRFYYLFRYLESIHRYRFARIRPPSC